MSDYDGFANWGTWNLTNIIWGDTEEEIADGLAAIPVFEGPRVVTGGWGHHIHRYGEYVRERIEELASCEPADGPISTTLLREGTENIDWDALALYWRKED